ncbi:MAG: RecX family transcriptional regulator [Lachnospiraceae bacterium]|jgi:regulatory protein|nr:RecX family transcriptional regulator [Lachnospiraceae bacterium]
MLVIEIKNTSKNKYKVVLEDGMTIPMYKSELEKYKVSLEKDFPSEEIQRFYKEVLYKRGKLRVMHLLEKSQRTEKELRDKLKSSYYPQDVIDVAIDYVKSFHYVDDEQYARNLIEYLSNKISKRDIILKLRTKGVSSDIIENTIDKYYKDENTDELILKIISKRKYDKETATNEEKQKIYRYLSSKGFSYYDFQNYI